MALVELLFCSLVISFCLTCVLAHALFTCLMEAPVPGPAPAGTPEEATRRKAEADRMDRMIDEMVDFMRRNTRARQEASPPAGAAGGFT